MCRSRRELSNAYLLAKIGFDTAENEPCKVCPLSAHRSGSLSLLLQIPQVDALLANFTATKGEVLQNQPEDSLAYAKASGALTRVELEHKQIEDHILNLSNSRAALPGQLHRLVLRDVQLLGRLHPHEPCHGDDHGVRRAERVRVSKIWKISKILQIFGGLVSAVSKRNFARKYAFGSLFQALQDLHPFAPLQSQNFRKKSV